MKSELFSVYRQISIKEARKMIIEQSNRVHIGHIGSALSVVDILGRTILNVINWVTPLPPKGIVLFYLMAYRVGFICCANPNRFD